jgi:N-acetylmuramoyl-L-alanine amidase CwlA
MGCRFWDPMILDWISQNITDGNGQFHSGDIGSMNVTDYYDGSDKWDALIPGSNSVIRPLFKQHGWNGSSSGDGSMNSSELLYNDGSDK